MTITHLVFFMLRITQEKKDNKTRYRRTSWPLYGAAEIIIKSKGERTTMLKNENSVFPFEVLGNGLPWFGGQVNL